MADYRAGVLASMFRNAHRPKNSKASEPGDFFASLREDVAVQTVATKPKGHTPEQLLAIFQVITGAKVQ